jgi:hypothetical protein
MPATAASCVLTLEQTEGPYYIDDALVRRDVTDGKLGVPLRLRLTSWTPPRASRSRAPRSRSGTPMRSASTPASGPASGSRTFLGGAQRTDAA